MVQLTENNDKKCANLLSSDCQDKEDDLESKAEERDRGHSIRLLISEIGKLRDLSKLTQLVGKENLDHNPEILPPSPEPTIAPLFADQVQYSPGSQAFPRSFLTTGW